MFPRIACAVLIVLVAGCEAEKKETTPVRMSLAAVNSSPNAGATAGAPGVLTAPLTVVPRSSAITTLMPANSIASGPPDSMKIYVRAVSFEGDASSQVFASTDARGIPITLTNETIDLAQALGVTSLSATVGSYRAVNLTVSRVAEIKGCVTGAFLPTNSTSGQLSEAILAAAPLHGSNVYSNDPVPDTEPRTFCTQTARSQVSVYTYSTQPIGSNAEFQSSTPEVTEIDLERGNIQGLSPEQIRAATVTVSSRFPFEVVKDQETKLLLAVDLNRMLRYFANTREDRQPPNPTMKAGTSYFFSTVFQDSTILAPADGTSIEGYRLTVEVNQGGGPTYVEVWLTVIRGADGKPIGGVIIPDDDNTLTVAKGAIDGTASTETAPGSWKLVFSLGDAGAGTAQSGSLDGFVFQDVGATETCGLTTFPTATVGEGTTFTVTYERIL